MSADGGVPIIVPGAGDAPARGRRINWFAGGGLTSRAMRAVFGEDPDAALNHWPTAVYSHMRHHPGTQHFISDVWEVDPRSVFPGEPIGFGWFSPDCTDFSKAKGKALRSERRRGLAWVICDWAALRCIDVILMENVAEWLGWGPLYPEGHEQAGERIPGREGETFREWRGVMEWLGYVLEFRTLVSADYGDPTTRERLYGVMRRDGRPIAWPARTHAPRKDAARLGLKPWRGVCEVLDFSLPCPSIFMSRAEAKAEHGLRVNRPLKAATLRRVARGIDRFVIRSGNPFIVPITQRSWGGDRAHDAAEPLKTATSSKGGDFALGQPFLAPVTHPGDARVGDAGEPLSTVTAANRGEISLVAPVIAHLAHGDHTKGPGDRVRDARDPLNAIKAGGGDQAVAAAHLTKFRGGSAGADLDEPCPTVTANSYVKRPGGAAPLGVVAASIQRQFGTAIGSDAGEPLGAVLAGAGGGKSAVAAAFMTTFQQNIIGSPPDEPLGTVMAGAPRHGLSMANLVSYYGQDAVLGSDAGEPMRTATGKDRHGLSTAFVHQANTGLVGRECTDPASTIVLKGCTQQLVEARLALEGGEVGRRGQVLAFLWEHFGEPDEGQWADPAGTVEARLKFGLVILPSEDGAGQVWMIVDIGLRMLTPRELMGAMGHEGPDGDLSTDAFGKPITRTDQTHMIGNGTSRHTVEALIRANCMPPEAAAEPELEAA
ncbi:MAG: DNA cytosine methyltransferase [Caulobacter sp.]|nr:DNA cytosine methyltransferase [Caulobacter sp.]